MGKPEVDGKSLFQLFSTLHIEAGSRTSWNLGLICPASLLVYTEDFSSLPSGC